MKTVDHLTAPGTLVQHLTTCQFGVFAGVNEHHQADCTWDDLTNTSEPFNLIAEVTR